MGCGCGGRKAAPVQTTQAPPEAGDYVVTYPNGATQTFKGVSARRLAAREALASGGSYVRVSG